MKPLILLTVLVLLVMTALAQHPTHSKLYKIVVTDGGMAGTYSNNKQISYVRILVYVINNSNDTLKYCGTDWCYKDIFSISKNHYLFLANQDSQKELFIKNTIPPHRSQKIELLLAEYKSPDTIINLNIRMKLFRWGTGKSDNLNNKYLIDSFTDNVTIQYDKNHNEYVDNRDLYQKEKNIPPNINLHLLTPNERKLYTLTIDQQKITKPHYGLTYDKKRISKFNIPVLLNNNSNDTLKFLTMTCSWDDDFEIDNKYIQLNGSICESNFPTEVKVPPHGSFLRVLPVNIDPVNIVQGPIKKSIKFKAGMSLTINDNRYLFLNLYPFETGEFNQIWSNEVEVPQ